MYNFIVKNLKHGHWVAVKSKNGYWKVFTHLRRDGRIEGNSPKETIKESLDADFSVVKYSKEDIEETFTKEYKIETPAPVLLEPGTKVEILENIREYAEKKYCDEKVEMIGKKGFEIRGNYLGDYVIYTKDKYNAYTFPHWAVAPIYEPENKSDLDNYSDDEIIAHLEKRGRLKDKKVIE